MNIKKMSKEELELLSYTDIAYYLIEGYKKPKNTAKLFKEICDMLELSEAAYIDKIGDFYTALTTDKRFVLLKDATWDLRSRQSSSKFIVEIEDDEEIDIEEEETEEAFETEVVEEDDNYDAHINDDDFVDEEDALEELSIVEEDFEAEE
jgi:DNA-directed RNA polymerase subunit delta